MQITQPTFIEPEQREVIYKTYHNVSDLDDFKIVNHAINAQNINIIIPPEDGCFVFNQMHDFSTYYNSQWIITFVLENKSRIYWWFNTKEQAEKEYNRIVNYNDDFDYNKLILEAMEFLSDKRHDQLDNLINRIKGTIQRTE